MAIIMNAWEGLRPLTGISASLTELAEEDFQDAVEGLRPLTGISASLTWGFCDRLTTNTLKSPSPYGD